MVGIGSDDFDGIFGERRPLRPVDGIEQDCSLRRGEAGGPELSLAGGVVGVPGKKTAAVGCDRARGKTQETIS